MSETPSAPPAAHAGDSTVEVLDEARPAPNGAYPRPESFSGVWAPEVIEEIQEKAALGRYQIRGQATKRAGSPPSTTSCSCRPGSRACRSKATARSATRGW